MILNAFNKYIHSDQAKTFWKNKFLPIVDFFLPIPI